MIDMVTTPDGSLVAMVHCNNCTSDINAWVSVFREYGEMIGAKVDVGEIYDKLFKKALEGDADCGGLIAYNYVSGGPVAGLAAGRPWFVRSATDKFNLANFMRTNLYASVCVLKIGNDILFHDENVQVDRITAHGGLFKTPLVGQRILAAALGSPISVMQTAGEGGAWGIALLAGYMANNPDRLTLADYLEKVVFAGNTGTSITPDPADVEGFEKYIADYKRGLAIEKCAVDNKK
jgi:sugar (pentulose or hexulose) kinase